MDFVRVKENQVERRMRLARCTSAAPGPADTALFDATTSGGAFSLGAPLSWFGRRVTDASGPVTISDATYSLSLGAGGIDLLPWSGILMRFFPVRPLRGLRLCEIPA